MKARISGGEFIDEPGAERAAQTDGYIVRGPEDFTPGGIAGDHDGAAIEGIAVQGVLLRAEPAAEEVVPVADHMINAGKILRSANLKGRIPGVDSSVQAVAGCVGVWSRITAEHLFDGGVHTNTARIASEHVEALHAIDVGAGGAVAHAGSESAATLIDEQR